MNGAVEAIRELNDRGYYVFVSHPAGGAHRTPVAGDTFRLNAAVQQRLVAEGAHVDRFYGEAAYPADIAPAHVTAAAEEEASFQPHLQRHERMADCPRAIFLHWCER